MADGPTWLALLEETIIQYFPNLDMEKFDWYRNSFVKTVTSVRVYELSLQLILLPVCHKILKLIKVDNHWANHWVYKWI